MRLFNLEPSAINGDFIRDTLLVRYDVIDFTAKKKLGRESFLTSYSPLPAEWCHDGPRSDFPASSGAMIGVTEKAVSVISSILPPDIDVLDLKADEEGNPKCSLLLLWGKVGPEDCEIVAGGFPHIESVKLKTQCLPSMFHLKGNSALLVTDKFKHAWEQAGLTGADFKEIEVIIH